MQVLLHGVAILQSSGRSSTKCTLLTRVVDVEGCIKTPPQVHTSFRKNDLLSMSKYIEFKSVLQDLSVQENEENYKDFIQIGVMRHIQATVATPAHSFNLPCQFCDP